MRSADTSSKNGPKFLVSARDADEAVAALAGGAQWIDLKEPNRGPLGAVSVRVARDAVTAVAGRCPVSAALGELIDWPNAASRKLLDLPEIEVVKLGLADCALDAQWLARWQRAAGDVVGAGKLLAAVVYADARRAQAPAPEIVVKHASDIGCHFLLIDTFDKGYAPVLEQLELGDLVRILQLARRVGLSTVVAGGLSVADTKRLPIEGIDLIAVRGGVCRGSRTGTVDAELVREFRRAIANHWPAGTGSEAGRRPPGPKSA